MPDPTANEQLNELFRQAKIYYPDTLPALRREQAKGTLTPERVLDLLKEFKERREKARGFALKQVTSRVEID